MVQKEIPDSYFWTVEMYPEPLWEEDWDEYAEDIAEDE
jgi:hypothetical protein